MQEPLRLVVFGPTADEKLGKLGTYTIHCEVAAPPYVHIDLFLTL